MRAATQGNAGGESCVDDPRVPLVSILIRSMDRPTLTRALDSAARQTWRNIELVVVAANGANHRGLPETHLGRPLRFVASDTPLSRPLAANVALENASGEWLNFLDDDDEMLPEHVATLLGAPRDRGERIVFSATRVLDAAGKTLGQISHAGNHVQLFSHSRATSVATLIHRSLIDEGVRFDPDFAVHEDHDFQINCATRTPFLFVDRVTCLWHSQDGASGCGFGSNDDPAQRIASLHKIRAKWAPAFDIWFRDFDAVLFTGQQYLKRGDGPAALECLERALFLRPDDINALNLCGMANLRIGRVDRAEELLAKAALRLPGHVAIQENLRLIRSRRSGVRRS